MGPAPTRGCPHPAEQPPPTRRPDRAGRASTAAPGDSGLLSIGDPNGIGPEIAVGAAARPRPPPVLVGDRHVVEPCARRVGPRVREVAAPTSAEPGLLDLLAVGALPPGRLRPGVVSAEAGAATVAYLRAAVAGALAGIGHAVVACPYSEAAVDAAGIAFRGHPGPLAQLTGVPADQVFLLLVGGGLAMVHVTLHQRLADALTRLTPELVTSAELAAKWADHPDLDRHLVYACGSPAKTEAARTELAVAPEHFHSDAFVPSPTDRPGPSDR